PLFLSMPRQRPGAPLFPYTTLFRSLDQRLCGPGRRFPQPGALGLEPALELRSVRDEEPFEERAVVQVRGFEPLASVDGALQGREDRKSTRLNSSHVAISYAVFCLKK